MLKPNPQHSLCCCLTVVWPPAAMHCCQCECQNVHDEDSLEMRLH